MSSVDIKNLNVWFGQAADRVNAVIDASLHVESGASFGLVGESGSGKSTILRALTGLVPDWSGSMTVADETLGRTRNRLVRGDPPQLHERANGLGGCGSKAPGERARRRIASLRELCASPRRRTKIRRYDPADVLVRFKIETPLPTPPR